MDKLHQSLVEELTVLVTPILDDLGFELVDLEYAREGRDLFLRRRKTWHADDGGFAGRVPRRCSKRC